MLQTAFPCSSSPRFLSWPGLQFLEGKAPLGAEAPAVQPLKVGAGRPYSLLSFSRFQAPEGPGAPTLVLSLSGSSLAHSRVCSPAWLWVGLIMPSSFLLETGGAEAGRLGCAGGWGEPPLTWAPELLCLKPRLLSLAPKQEGHYGWLKVTREAGGRGFVGGVKGRQRAQNGKNSPSCISWL